MGDRLHEQLEEMEQQLGLLKGAVEAFQDAEKASDATVSALNDVQQSLAKACEQFMLVLKSQFDEFSEDGKRNIEHIEELLKKLDKLDASALAKLIDKNKQELGDQSEKQLADHAKHLLDALGHNAEKEQKLTKEILEAHESKICELLDNNATEDRDILVTKLTEHREELKAQQLEIETKISAEGAELKNRLDEQEDASEERMSNLDARLDSLLEASKMGAKQAKQFSIIAACLAGAAFLSSLVGLFV